MKTFEQYVMEDDDNLDLACVLKKVSDSTLRERYESLKKRGIPLCVHNLISVRDEDIDKNDEEQSFVMLDEPMYGDDYTLDDEENIVIDRTPSRYK